MSRATVDLSVNPPLVSVPHEYNAAEDFLDHHPGEGRSDKVAFIDAAGSHTYEELVRRSARAGNALRSLGVGMETRLMMCMLDTVDFPAVFWGAVKLGAVPIPVNTLLTSRDYAYMLRDSRAKVLVVSAALWPAFEDIVADLPDLEHIIVAGGPAQRTGQMALDELLGSASDQLDNAPTTSDDVAFWLYTSGSTGAPKGSVHLHRDIVYTATVYAQGVLGIGTEDVVFSAAKLFFAYGLGNGMTFPMYVGATAVLFDGRPTPDAVMDVLREHQPTIYYGVPTLYGAILASADNQRATASDRLRVCVSAGEALPEELGRLWEQRFGAPILDGLGSTEMLHIFLSNRTDALRYGTSGKAVPGYELKLVDESGDPPAQGDIGELWVKGGSAAVAYWNQRDKSLSTFHGPWTRTGDKYLVDADGFYQYCGRTDDMLKVSGQWVSPFEVESALLAHDAVLEAAVVGQEDEKNLVKPKAYVILNEGHQAGESLAEDLQGFVKGRLAPFKYPRWIEFRDDLPKTATGKIQRFKLRD